MKHFRTTVSSITRAFPVLLFLFIAPGVASKPDYYAISFHPVPLSGETTGNLEKSAIPPNFNARHAPGASPDKSIAQYRASIQELVESGGPFNPLLIQETEALGDLLLESGSSDEAIDAFEKSLHIIRVNEGLNTPRQEALLRKLIRTELKVSNLERAHALHESLFHLQKKNYETGDPELINAILEWADWHVDRLRLEENRVNASPGNPMLVLSQNLLTAQESYIDAIELLQDSPAEDMADRLVYAEKRLAVINYIANSAQSVPQSSFSPYVDVANPFAAPNMREENTNMGYFFNGSNALKRAIAYCLESPQPDYLFIAEQIMTLGDWYLLFDRRAAALEIYEDAFEVLAATNASEEDVARIMSPGMPVSLPDSPSPTNPETFSGYIDVEFQVNRFGKASRPEVIGGSEQDVSPVTQALIRKIRRERFRPAFVDGSASSSENVKLRYYYSYN